MAKGNLNHLSSCQRCGLHKTRTKVVIGRGTLPADILFIGEGPGSSEDIIGKPFVGPVGRVLDHLILYSAQDAGLRRAPTFYLTNSVLCRPTDDTGKNRQPYPPEVWQCEHNLTQIINEVNPLRCVLLGEVAKRYYLRRFPGALTMYHPAYLLRKGGMETPEFRQCLANLSQLFTEVKEARKCQKRQVSKKPHKTV